MLDFDVHCTPLLRDNLATYRLSTRWRILNSLVDLKAEKKENIANNLKHHEDHGNV